MNRKLTLEQRVSRLEKLIVNEKQELTFDMAYDLEQELISELRKVQLDTDCLTCEDLPYNQIEIVYDSENYPTMKFYLDAERNTLVTRLQGMFNDYVSKSPRLEVHAKAIANFIREQIDDLDSRRLNPSAANSRARPRTGRWF